MLHVVSTSIKRYALKNKTEKAFNIICYKYLCQNDFSGCMFKTGSDKTIHWLGGYSFLLLSEPIFRRHFWLDWNMTNNFKLKKFGFLLLIDVIIGIESPNVSTNPLWQWGRASLHIERADSIEN